MERRALEVGGLRFAYPVYAGSRKDPVLNGIDLSLEPGKGFAIVAGADAGKSTLARILAGLIPRFSGGSVSGRASFGGFDLLATRPFDLVELVGVVFQNADEQLVSTRCDTEAAFALESLGIPRPVMKDRVAVSLDLMGMSGFASRNPATLSGGEKKRLLISCIAAADPDLWILDEALEELDPVWKTRLVEHVKSRGKSALFLDSRWSSLYASCCSGVSVLRHGALTPSMAPGSSGLASLLADEGVTPPVSPAVGASRRISGPVLSAKNISFRFGDGPGAFSLDVDSLELEKGAICSLLGKNGSGKSTLGRILCGLLAPEKGGIRLQDGKGNPELSRKELNGRVAYIFQNPDYQIFLATVREELELGLGERERRDGRVEEVMSTFNLPDADAPPALMSYGARKRLQAATYHLLQRDFIILDESDSGLSYREYLSILSAISAGGAGILLITHDRELAFSVSDRVLLMEDGRIIRSADRGRFQELEG